MSPIRHPKKVHRSARKQEMAIDECVSKLRKRIRRLHPCNADGIVSYIISLKTPVEIRQYLFTSNDQIQRLIVEAKSSSLPSSQLVPLLPPPQPLSGGIYTPFIHWQPHFHPSSSYHGIQPALYPIDQVGQLQQHQFYPSGSCHGIRSQNTPIGSTGAFQSPFPGFIGLEEHFQSLSIPGDGLPSNYGNACQSVTGYPPSSSKEQTKPCHFLFSMGYCKKGENCPFSHGSDSPEMNNMKQVQTLELSMLEKEISELLLSLQPPRVPIESLASIYNERRGQCYIVPVEEAPKYLDDDFKLVRSPAGNGSNQIYITIGPKSTFTLEYVWNYFSSLKRRQTAQNDAHSNSDAHKASGVNVIHEHHTDLLPVDNTAEPSHVPSQLDEAPAAQDSDDLGLPGSLDDIY